MYADHLIMLSESGTGLHVAMDKLRDYCTINEIVQLTQAKLNYS